MLDAVRQASVFTIAFVFPSHEHGEKTEKKISAFHFMDEECFGIYCTVATADGYYHFVLKKHISLSSVCEKKCFRCRDLIKLSHCADDDASIVGCDGRKHFWIIQDMQIIKINRKTTRSIHSIFRIHIVAKHGCMH